MGQDLLSEELESLEHLRPWRSQRQAKAQNHVIDIEVPLVHFELPNAVLRGATDEMFAGPVNGEIGLTLELRMMRQDTPAEIEKPFLHGHSEKGLVSLLTSGGHPGIAH